MARALTVEAQAKVRFGRPSRPFEFPDVAAASGYHSFAVATTHTPIDAETTNGYPLR